jgi:phage terminase small subunit
MLVDRYHIPLKAVKQLEKQGFSDKKTSLIIALEQLRKVTQRSIVTMARQDNMSWSEITHSFELTPSSVGKMILE